MMHPGNRPGWRVHSPGAASGTLRRTAVTALTVILLAGCGLIGGPRIVRLAVPNQMTVTSQDIVGGALPRAFTCDGAGKHPGLHWSGAPVGTKSLAVVMDDAAAPITPYIYWIVFDIGPQSTDIQAGSLPHGARQAENSKGMVGYAAPCPKNPGHSYRFTVYALGKMLPLSKGVNLKSAWLAIAQAAIARGRLTAAANP